VYKYYVRGEEIEERVKGMVSVRSIRENIRREVSKTCSKEVSSKIFTEEEQLKYIMPKEILKEMGIEKEWDEEVSYEWAYCDHFWEADVIVTRIPLIKK
jgi:hypothetical protein